MVGRKEVNKIDFYDFLAQFVAGDVLHVAAVAIIVGGAVFGIIQGIDQILKNGNRPELSSNVKFWTAVLLCFLIPYASYILVTANDHRPLSVSGVALAFGVAFVAATGLHWILGGSQNAKVSQALWDRAKVQGTIPPDGPNT